MHKSCSLVPLEETGSDIACGGVNRISTLGARPSWLHEEPFRRTMRRTHVSRFPVLLQDRTASNKVFRRSFWDEHGFEFGNGLYEDGPTLRAHVLASSVDVFSDVVYYWRVRESGDLSITQRSREFQNVEQRMSSITSVASFLTATAPSLKPFYDQSVLKGDTAMLVNAYAIASDTERERLAKLAADYLSHVDQATYRDVPVLNRLECYLLSKGMLTELLEVLRFVRRGDNWDAPVVPSGGLRGERCIVYPFFRDPILRIPVHIYDVTSEITLNATLDAAMWRGAKLRLEGHAYIRRLDCPAQSDSRIRVALRNRKTRRTIRLRVERVFRPDVTARSGQSAASYDWSGFAVEVAPRRLATLPGVWRPRTGS